jgi:hypothetical protein
MMGTGSGGSSPGHVSRGESTKLSRKKHAPVARLDDQQRPIRGQHLEGLATMTIAWVVFRENVGRPTRLRDILTSELQAQIGDDSAWDGKVTLQGPEVTLPPASAQALGLAIHELATNAAKYGAFRQEVATLEILWSVTHYADEPWLELKWIERGVDLAIVGRASRKGYVSELIERALPYQLNARTELQFAADGVRCTIEVPIDAAGRKESDVFH